MSAFKFVNDRETEEEKNARFEEQDVKLLSKITERQSEEVTKFNKQVVLRIQEKKEEEKLEVSNKMKEYLDQPIDIPDSEEADIENSTFVIND